VNQRPLSKGPDKANKKVDSKRLKFPSRTGGGESGEIQMWKKMGFKERTRRTTNTVIFAKERGSVLEYTGKSAAVRW